MSIQIGIRESLSQIFTVIFLGIVIYVLYKIYDEVLQEITIHRGGLSSSFGKVLRPIFKIIGAAVIIIGGLIYGLSIFNINVTALLAGAGVFGLVIAFAAQDTLSNFFSGIHLLLDRPFRLGDIIHLESGEYCRVENVGMRSTKLYSLFDHELIILPNNTMANQKIINIVKPDMKIRKKIEVGVAYGSNVEKVKKILYESAANHPDVLTDKKHEPIVRFTGFGDSSLDFSLLYTVNDVMNQWKTNSDVITEIDNQFRKEHVTIPFPQRTIWFNEVKKSNKKKKELNQKDDSKQ
jgi:small-conductance mechanosensitive channel